MPPHCLERPLQIDGCRPCRGKSGAGRLEIRVGRLFAHCKRQAIGRSHTDERRATDLHILDGSCRLRHGGDRNDFEFMRQPRLIDDLDARLFVVQPNGSKNPASDPHESAPSPCLTVSRMRALSRSSVLLVNSAGHSQPACLNINALGRSSPNQIGSKITYSWPM